MHYRIDDGFEHRARTELRHVHTTGFLACGHPVRTLRDTFRCSNQFRDGGIKQRLGTGLPAEVAKTVGMHRIAQGVRRNRRQLGPNAEPSCQRRHDIVGVDGQIRTIEGVPRNYIG